MSLVQVGVCKRGVHLSHTLEKARNTMLKATL